MIDYQGYSLEELPHYYRHTKGSVSVGDALFHELPGYNRGGGNEPFEYWGDAIVLFDEGGNAIGYLPRIVGGELRYYAFESRELEPVWIASMRAAKEAVGIKARGKGRENSDTVVKSNPPGALSPEIVEKRANALKLLSMRSVWLDRDFRDPPQGSFGLKIDAHGDPRLVFNPELTTDLVENKSEEAQGVPLRRWPLIRGWSYAHHLITLNRREDSFEQNRDSSWRRLLPSLWLEVRGSKAVSKSMNEVFVIEPPDPEAVIGGQKGWRSGDLFEFDRDGKWRLTEAGQKLGLDSVWVTTPAKIKYALWHSVTSKMGCASFSLPAGPGGIHGSCPAAAPISLVENVSGARIAKAAWKRRLDAQGAVFRSVADIEESLSGSMAPGEFSTNTTKPEDNSFAPKEPKFVCSSCYALKSNYINVNVQFIQLARKKWVDEALKVDVNLKPFNSRIGHEAQGRKSFFTYAMTESIRVYYGSERQAARLGSGEDTRYYRIHDSGDFFSFAYYWAWVEIAKRLPEVSFWAPTRQWVWGVEWLKAFAEAPKNLAIRPSALQQEEAAPNLPGMAGGSAVAVQDLADHWVCPAAKTERGSCVGALAIVNRSSSQWQTWSSLLPSGERDCRVCWGGFQSQEPEKQLGLRLTPVAYRAH